ncbi:MAG: long-chain fatty acid--CoA ligase [Desulfobacterales bacterium]|nr:long-chain fatty acid--CoA ligase [Desulfobacterales bacterium]
MNVAQNIETAARLFPDKTAILFEGKQIKYSELNVMANRLANAMMANGIQKGDRVALYLTNIPEFAICYYATVKTGAIAVSVNPMLKSYELKHIMNDSGAALLFTVGELLENLERDEYENLKHVVVCEGDAQDNTELSTWMEKGAEEFQTADLAPNESASILYTSGTTGFPKGATLTHGNVVSNYWSTVHHAGYTPEDRMPVFLPLFHVFGQNFIMNGAFTACATLAMYRRFVPDVVLDSIGRDHVTMFFGVPAIYIALLNMDLSKYDLSSIRYEFSAASTMPREISSQWTERFGRPIFEGYGLTECSPFACYNHDFQHKFGSVGTPVENFETKILDEEDREVPLGKWGEICVRGPGVMRGYWNRPEETEQALRNGWLHSGDTGLMDDEGYVFIVDRVKDMINVAGFKIWPAEIEQFLYAHPAIKELAVYGVPHPEKGEIVRAAIVLKENASASAEDITSFCLKNLANYKVPTAVDFVDELPKSATGKILKRVLRDQVTEED